MRYEAGNCTIVISMNGVFKSTFKTSFERFFHADCNGPIPSFISHSHTKIWCVFHLTLDTWSMQIIIIWAMYYARYLGLGMRYGGGTCTIGISMNEVFKRCPFCCKLKFDPKSWKTMGYIIYIAFAWVRFLAKMWPTWKSTFRTSFERFFHADCNGAIPSFISHSCTKIRCVFHLTLEAKCF